MSDARAAAPPAAPDLSLVMPCYNEEAVVGFSIRRLTDAFDRAGYSLELIAVDNGSSDGTGNILRKLSEARSSIVCHRVEINEGYGNGILSGMPLCTAPLVGIITADGQVDPEDVVRLFEIAVVNKQDVIAKVRRRFRMDGAVRKIISLGYNVFVRILWPGLAWDVNSVPKILPRHMFAAMQLKSKGWALDPEIMIKAKYMGIRIIELNILSRERPSGTSKIRAAAMRELVVALLGFRFSRELSQLRSEWKARAVARSQSVLPTTALPDTPRV